MSTFTMDDDDDDVLLLENEENLNLVITSVVSLAKNLPKNEYGEIIGKVESDNHSQYLCNAEDMLTSTTPACSQPSAKTDTAEAASKLPTPKRTDSVSSKTSDEQPVVLIPNIENCLDGWKEIFPWVKYEQSSNTFMCSVCKWSYGTHQPHEVYKLVNANDVVHVARKLRSHTQKELHKLASSKLEFMCNICKGIYPLLKHSFWKITSLIDIENRVKNLLMEYKKDPRIDKETNLPHLLGLQNKSMASDVIQNIKVAIESQLLDSLKQSPYFSVIALTRIDFLIVRWLTQESEVVEHFFHCPDLLVLEYLELKGVKMDRMVSYSNLHGFLFPQVAYLAKMFNVASRPPSMEVLFKYLKFTGSLKSLFMHVNALPKLCRVAEKINPSPLIREIAQIEESKAYTCLLSKEILSFVLNNHALFDSCVDKSDIENKHLFSFQSLSLCNSFPEKYCIIALPVLNEILQDYDSEKTVTKLGNLQSYLKGFTKDFSLMAGTLVDLFISHTIICCHTQRSGQFLIVDIMVKDINSIEISEFELVCQTLIPECYEKGKGYNQLLELNAFLANGRSISPLKLLGELQFQPEHAAKFSALLKLGQKIMTLPTLNAHVERYSSELTIAGHFINGRVAEYLVPYLVYILVEGPNNVELLEKDSIMKAWLRSSL